MKAEKLTNKPKDEPTDEEILALAIKGDFSAAFSGMDLATIMQKAYLAKVMFRSGDLNIVPEEGTAIDRDLFTFMTTGDKPEDAIKHHEALMNILKRANRSKEEVSKYISDVMIPAYRKWPLVSTANRDVYIAGLQSALANVYPTIH